MDISITLTDLIPYPAQSVLPDQLKCTIRLVLSRERLLVQGGAHGMKEKQR
jgi:hypothetical protein